MAAMTLQQAYKLFPEGLADKIRSHRDLVVTSCTNSYKIPEHLVPTVLRLALKKHEEGVEPKFDAQGNITEAPKPPKTQEQPQANPEPSKPVNNSSGVDVTGTPKATPPDLFPKIPSIFKQFDAWVTYESAENKAPIQSGTFFGAKSNDPSTWVSYSVLLQNMADGKGYRNPGFVPDGERTNYLTAGDLDNCVNTQTGEIMPWAQRIIDFLAPTYVEKTVSGTGLRPWFILRQDWHKTFPLGSAAKANPVAKEAQIEVVNDKQYMTFSCNTLPQSVNTVRELSQAEAAAFFQLIADLQKEFAPATPNTTTTTTTAKTDFNAEFHPAEVYPRDDDGLLHGNRHKATVQEAGRMHQEKLVELDEQARFEYLTEWREKNVFGHSGLEHDAKVRSIARWTLTLPPSGKVKCEQQPDPAETARHQAQLDAKQAEREAKQAADLVDAVESAKNQLDAWLKEGSDTKLNLEEAAALTAVLPEIDYEVRRKNICKKLGISRPTLFDDVRGKLRPEVEAEDNLQGQALEVPDIEPWHEPVNIAEVLDEIERTFRRFIYFQRPDDAFTVALWCAMTWLILSLDIAPYLGIRSPEKECGKSTLLKLINRLVFHPLGSSNVTSASVFRVLDMHTVTMLIDELDTFLRYDSEFVGILNSGHSRELGRVLRCIGDDSEPRWFNTFGAKAYGMIGNATDTLESRSLSVILFPKIAEDGIEDLDFRENPEVAAALQVLSRKLARWSSDYTQAVLAIRPNLKAVTNRKRDNWRPLFQIAEFAGQGWVQKALSAAGLVEFSEEKSDQRLFIEDVRNIFHTRALKNPGVDFLPTHVLLADLHAQLESGWKHYGKGKDGMNQKDLANLMKSYGVKADRGRVDKVQARGYHVSQFEASFRRFLRDVPPEQVDLSSLDVTSPSPVEKRNVSQASYRDIN